MLKPLAEADWNYEAAAHLLNRAGFGGSPEEIEHLLAMGHKRAVSHLVDYERLPDKTSAPEWAKPDPDRAQKLAAARRAGQQERRQLQREEQQAQRQRITELRGWWLQRMISGARPLQEKLVLFWHGHFATSFEKVRDAYLMWCQNELFRRLADGNWEQLLVEAGRDPAMLIWLDQAQSRKQRPNENFAREVMELFALGEGHYTEKDIQEGARALTGWSYNRLTQRFAERVSWHDDGEKEVFGQRGNFDGDQFLRMIVARPEAAPYITGRLWQFFAGSLATLELAAALSDVFRRGNNSFKPVLHTIFLCEEFYSPLVRRNQVKSPVQWLVGSVKLLQRDLPAPPVSSGMLRNLGQDLFAPPNVKGWDGGLSWISTTSLLARYNQAAMLVQGEGRRGEFFPLRGRQGSHSPVDVARLFSVEERSDKERLIAGLQRRFLGDKLKPKSEAALREFLNSCSPLESDDIRNAIRLVMSTPEYQVA